MQHLNRDELLKMLRAAKDRSDEEWLMILVAFWHGLRASEVCGLTGAHVRDGFLSIQRLKGSLRTVQPLVSNDEPLLNELPLAKLAQQSGNSLLFPGHASRSGFFRLVRRAGLIAGLPEHKCHPHALKHSIAMQTIKKAGIENVRKYLGHKSIASTGEYLKVTDEEASEACVGAIK